MAGGLLHLPCQLGQGPLTSGQLRLRSRAPRSADVISVSTSLMATSSSQSASSRSIASRTLPNAAGRGSAGWLGGGWALGPLRASLGGLGVPENFRTIIRPGLGTLEVGSDDAERSDGGCVSVSAVVSASTLSAAASADPSKDVASAGSGSAAASASSGIAAASVCPVSAAGSSGLGPAAALASPGSADALGSGAGTGLDASGSPWTSAAPVGGPQEKNKDQNRSLVRAKHALEGMKNET
ncbi:uncharacterized protein LOC133917901 [Phragmites australis]|uniref:uncharacterized protein LOC133917901 n=1 Tax=Phragmites australis TaxID=29695 RepID=UPI002D791AE0|nr:uncharacterized protein LOC133917901 [Phragmites australis]